MLECLSDTNVENAVGDPGFPRAGSVNPPGAPTYNFAKFSQKLHEIERIWTPGGGGGVEGPPLECIWTYVTTEIKFNANIDVDWFNSSKLD